MQKSIDWARWERENPGQFPTSSDIPQILNARLGRYEGPVFPQGIEHMSHGGYIENKKLLELLETELNQYRWLQESYADPSSAKGRKLTTSDGYSWCSGQRLYISNTEVLILFPWAEDLGGTYVDRHTAVYWRGPDSHAADEAITVLNQAFNRASAALP